jgi:hypothetical protein
LNCGNIKPYNRVPHREFWTETWANYLSKQHFGSAWCGLEKNIRGFELWRSQPSPREGCGLEKNIRGFEQLYYPTKNISKEFLKIKFGM